MKHIPTFDAFEVKEINEAYNYWTDRAPDAIRQHSTMISKMFQEASKIIGVTLDPNKGKTDKPAFNEKDRIQFGMEWNLDKGLIGIIGNKAKWVKVSVVGHAAEEEIFANFILSFLLKNERDDQQHRVSMCMFMGDPKTGKIKQR